MGINLDFDIDLNDDAKGFGIDIKIPTIAHPPDGPLQGTDKNEVPIPIPISTPAPAPISGMSNRDAAIALAMEVCRWEFTFYTWCEEFLHGAWQEAIADIPYVRGVLKTVRNYWGPLYFTHGSEKARERYYGIMAAQAALTAAERTNVELLIQKIVYYTSIVHGDL